MIENEGKAKTPFCPVTDGDAPGLFGPSAGVIPSFSGFGGNLFTDFSTSFTSVAVTFAVEVPEPAPLWLVVLGGLAGSIIRRRKTSQVASKPGT